MCLDWIGKNDQAAPYYRRALDLDPNYWYPRAMMGWHAFQVEDYKTAHEWMVKSLQLNWTDNALARTYLALSEKMIAEQNAKPVRP